MCLIDTHCHLDAPAFAADRVAVIADAAAAGVRCIVIPAIRPQNFAAVRGLAHSLPQGAYALGIHPLAVPLARETDLDELARQLSASKDDPRLVAVGEIGLDFLVPELAQPAMRARQTYFYAAQLALARQYQLPVLLHGRKSHDALLKPLRRGAPTGGIAHAFNGSFQQAEQFIACGFALGFGGAMTWERALHIRRLAVQLPLHALVLETDAPDMPPAWLACPGTRAARNTPAQLARIAQVLAQLRALDVATVTTTCTQNAQRVLPRLQHLMLAG